MTNKCKQRGFKFMNRENDKVITVRGVCTKKQAEDKLRKRGFDDLLYLRKRK